MTMDEAFNDPRFGHIMSDPKFKKPPAFQRKVKIDNRFQRMFNDKNFQVKYTVDKRGKPVNQSSVENYGKFYALSDEEDSDSDDESENEDRDFASDSSLGERSKVNAKKTSKAKSDLGKNRTVLVKSKKNLEKVKGFEVDNVKHQKNKLKPKKGSKVGNEIQEETNDDDDDDDDDEEEEDDTGEEEDDESDEETEESEDDIPKEVKEEALKKVSQKRKLPQEIKDKLHDLSVDYARGMGVLSDSSSSDDSSEELSAEEEDDLEHDWGELDKDADRTDSATKRLAICNMDWDRIRAVDLMVLCSSFLPSGGVIESVSIYVSEFGRKRMEEEEVRGPIEIVEQKKVETEINLEDREEDDEEGDKYQMEQLRKYQLLRLKYFYAIVVCDSLDTAATLYEECDGLEYESSATRLDLRFVPDDVSFDEKPRDVCTKLPDISKYQPRVFLNTALQQGKVECTWDETDPERVKLAQKLHQMKGDDTIDDKELKMFLASSEEEDDENEEDQPAKENVTNDDDKSRDGSDSEESNDSDNEDGVKKNAIDKYRNLLAKIQEEDEKKKNRDVEMEITWGVGLKEKAQKMVDKKLKENVPMTPFEKMIEKKREKKKLKKKERTKKNGEDPENDDDSVEASSDDEDDIPDGIDMNDEYFREELEGFGPKKSKNKGKSKKNKHKSDSDNSEDDEEASRNARELELLFMNENGEDTKKKHFNLKKIMENEDDSKKKKKRKGRKQLIKNKKKEKEEVAAPYDDDFKINVADERFSALYSSHHFNIDPADAHFKKTKGMEAFIHEKLSRKDKNSTNDSTSLGKKKNIESVKPSPDNGLHPPKKSKLESTNDLSQIVNSIKRNTQFSKTKSKR